MTRREPDTTYDDSNFQAQHAELTTLWPRLAAALIRDRGTSDSVGTNRNTTSTAGSGSSLANTDVVGAINLITRQLPDVDAEIRMTLGRPLRRDAVPVPIVLAALTNYRRALTPTYPAIVATLDRGVHHWLYVTRRALLLNARSRPLGRDCPDHRTTRPTPLLVEGDRATLHPEIVAGRRQPDRVAPLTWSASTTVTCPTCQCRWRGIVELRDLADRLAAADEQGTAP